jgi:hypothetical protein
MKRIIDPLIRCHADLMDAKSFLVDGMIVVTFDQRRAECLARNETRSTVSDDTDDNQPGLL